MTRTLLTLVLLLVATACASVPEDGSATRDTSRSNTTETTSSVGAEGGFYALSSADANVATEGTAVVSADEEPSGSMRPDAAQLTIWREPSFKRRFLESYLAVTEVEPPVTLDERDQVQKAFELMAAEEFDKALQTLEKEAGPNASAVLDIMIGSLYYQRDDFESALASYRIAVDKHPKFRRAWRELGQTYVRLGEYERALGAFIQFFETGGADAISYGLLGVTHTNLRNFLAAESAFRMATLLDPATLEWKLGLVSSLFEQGRYAETIALTNGLIDEYPDVSKFWLIQATCYIGTKQPLEAVENYEFVDRMGASTAQSLNNLADIYVNEGLYDMGVDAYVRMLTQFPDAEIGRAMLAARSLAIRGAVDEARILAETIENVRGERLTEKNRKTLLQLRARLAVAEGATEEEIRILEEIVALDPLDGDAIIKLGQHSRRNENFEKAEFFFERAAGIEEFEGAAKLGHAELLVQQGEYRRAVPLLKRAHALMQREDVGAFLADVERAAQKP